MNTDHRAGATPRERARFFRVASLCLVLVGATGVMAQQPSSSNPSGSSLADKATGIPSSWEALSEAFGGAKADTKPSRDAVMQFSVSLEIREVVHRGGARVKKGEVLVRARDAEIQAALERQKILAASTNEVENAAKQLELAQFRFDRLKTSSFSPVEFEEARIAQESAKLQHEQAKTNLKAQQAALKQIEGQAERFYLEAPFDGVIEDMMVEVGQGVTEQDKVLRIVNTEKLILDAYAQTAETLRLGLREKSKAWVLVHLGDKPRVVEGTVLYVSPVADSVSQTRRVRVEIDNPESWPAGTSARARFTDPGKEFERLGTPSTLSAAEHSTQTASTEPRSEGTR